MYVFSDYERPGGSMMPDYREVLEMIYNSFIVRPVDKAATTYLRIQVRDYGSTILLHLWLSFWPCYV